MSEQENFRSCRPLSDTVLESVSNAIFITDAAGHIVWMNNAFSQLSGYTKDEIIGKTPAILKSGLQRDSFYDDLWRTIVAGGVWRGIIHERRKDGMHYTVDQTITPLLDEQGKVAHFVAIQIDTTGHVPENELDHYLAYHDTLTGLPNRAHFRNIEQQHITHAQQTGKRFAILFLDLDKFKEVNDTFGHATGDLLLRAVAERLNRAVRKDDTVARLGGDEFAVLLPALPDFGLVTSIARKLNEAIAQPFHIEGKTLSVSLSIGVSSYPADGEEADMLMHKADEAMYRVKKRGGNAYCFYGGHDI